MKSFSDNLIDTLGGTTATSRKAETPLSTVHSWRSNGIPPGRLAHLKLIAEQEGLRIDWETGLPLEAGDGGAADHVDADTTTAGPASPGKSGEVTGAAL